jgi:hypothetical protein
VPALPVIRRPSAAHFCLLSISFWRIEPSSLLTLAFLVPRDGSVGMPGRLPVLAIRVSRPEREARLASTKPKP